MGKGVEKLRPKIWISSGLKPDKTGSLENKQKIHKNKHKTLDLNQAKILKTRN